MLTCKLKVSILFHRMHFPPYLAVYFHSGLVHESVATVKNDERSSEADLDVHVCAWL